jgi:uncharacterized protein (TIGR02118 family)
VTKVVGILSAQATELHLDAPHWICPAEPTDAILAELAGAHARPQRHAGLVCVWPRDAAECAAAEAVLRPVTAALHRTREVLHWDELGRPEAPAVVLIYFVRRRADLSFDAFADHYQHRHAPLARVHHPGIARYVQNFVEQPADCGAEIDAVSELWFRSEQDARSRFYRDDESRRVIAEDVRRFIDLRAGTAFAARPGIHSP